MSQQQVVQDHEEHRKEIVMCAYAPRDTKDNLREWASKISGIDCVTMETVIDESWKLIINWDDKGIRESKFGIRTFNIEKGELADEVKREIRKSNYMELEHNISETQKPINTLSTVKFDLMRYLFEELPNTISGGYLIETERPRLGAYEVEETEDDEESFGDKVINPSINGFEKRRILKKESEREPGSMYESFGKVPSYQFSLSLEAPSEELINAWTEEVIINLHKILNKRNGVRAVRYTSCEVTTKKEGECFI